MLNFHLCLVYFKFLCLIKFKGIVRKIIFKLIKLNSLWIIFNLKFSSFNLALQNGGGAFLIPYFIMLTFIGRPGYYLEMIMGQYSSRSSVRVFDCVPAMRGEFSLENLNKSLNYSSSRCWSWATACHVYCQFILCCYNGDFPSLFHLFFHGVFHGIASLGHMWWELERSMRKRNFGRSDSWEFNNAFHCCLFCVRNFV